MPLFPVLEMHAAITERSTYHRSEQKSPVMRRAAVNKRFEPLLAQGETIGELWSHRVVRLNVAPIWAFPPAGLSNHETGAKLSISAIKIGSELCFNAVFSDLNRRSQE
jgi:hypothetical protein